MLVGEKRPRPSGWDIYSTVELARGGVSGLLHRVIHGAPATNLSATSSSTLTSAPLPAPVQPWSMRSQFTPRPPLAITMQQQQQAQVVPPLPGHPSFSTAAQSAHRGVAYSTQNSAFEDSLSFLTSSLGGLSLAGLSGKAQVRGGSGSGSGLPFPSPSTRTDRILGRSNASLQRAKAALVVSRLPTPVQVPHPPALVQQSSSASATGPTQALAPSTLVTAALLPPTHTQLESRVGGDGVGLGKDEEEEEEIVPLEEEEEEEEKQPSPPTAAPEEEEEDVVVVSDSESEVLVVDDDCDVLVVDDEEEEEEEEGKGNKAAPDVKASSPMKAAAAPNSSSSSSAAAASTTDAGGGSGSGSGSAATAPPHECAPLDAAQALRLLQLPLPKEDETRLREAMGRSRSSPEEVLNKVETNTFTCGDSGDLRQGTWLRDATINFFFLLLRVAGVAALAEGGPRESHVWAHNSFFFAKLVGQSGPQVYKYEGVKSWTAGRKSKPGVDIFAYRRVIMPINRGNSHWAMAMIDMEERKVYFLDSLRGNGSDVIKHLIQYLKDEWKDKKGGELPWTFTAGVSPDTLPRQQNGVDCGAFVCAFGECFARGLFPTSDIFNQSNLGYWRIRIGVSNLLGKLIG
jgi:sentrin-specific protease 1